ncbi:MAG TPA: hypothetical protein VFS73_13265 [Solirubrobacterales bacterium]|nr:hypothetical protein [Solirubrobacterales bacterium]
MIVANPVDVVEDQGHAPTAPDLILAADLASAILQALVEQPVLQVAATERGALDQDLLQRRR